MISYPQIEVYNLGGIGAFWAKKVTQGKSAKFIKIFEIYQVSIYSFLSQNVPIFPNHILLTRTKSIFNPSTNFYCFPTLCKFSSIKIGAFPFFSSSGMHQSHHLVGCHVTDSNSLLNSF